MSNLGTGLAVHTRHQVIHAAEWMEFSSRMEELVAEGRERDAWRLWASVVELVHLGSPGPALSTAGFPPVRRFACANIPLCSLHGSSGRCPVPMDRSVEPPLPIGSRGTWTQRYHERPARLDLLALQWLASDVGPLDILPVHVGLAVERLDEGAMASPWTSSSFWSGSGSKGGGHGGNHGPLC